MKYFAIILLLALQACGSKQTPVPVVHFGEGNQECDLPRVYIAFTAEGCLSAAEWVRLIDYNS